MSENFIVEIISPDESILKSEATEVILPSYEPAVFELKNPNQNIQGRVR